MSDEQMPENVEVFMRIGGSLAIQKAKGNSTTYIRADLLHPEESYECDYCGKEKDVDDFIQLNEDGDSACPDCCIEIQRREIARLTKALGEAEQRESLVADLIESVNYLFANMLRHQDRLNAIRRAKEALTALQQTESGEQS